MLVLSRKRDEAIMIGDDVEVVVVDVRGDKVRLGVRAPGCVAVHRREVFDHVRSTVDLPLPPQAIDPSHELCMRAAIEEARKSLAEGGLPIGSVLVRDNEIIGRGHNRRVQRNDPMAHAEIVCLTNAGRQSTYRDTVLYSTLMPCYLCSGAVVQFGVPKVVVGESVTFPGSHAKCDGSPAFMKSRGIHLVDLHNTECIEMMRTFIEKNPTLWNEDIGVN